MDLGDVRESCVMPCGFLVNVNIFIFASSQFHQQPSSSKLPKLILLRLIEKLPSGNVTLDDLLVFIDFNDNGCHIADGHCPRGF